jgi:hypothetical protein
MTRSLDSAGVVPSGAPTTSTLRSEATVFSPYLLGADPPPEIVARYVGANQVLFHGNGSVNDMALVRLATRRPATLPFLDAATGVLRPRSLLRRKLLLMASILEATPAFADDFLPERLSWPRLLGRLAWAALTTTPKVVVGVALLVVTRWSGRG